ncbi:galactosylgalactosylxylosylprotein 3-beta-glucuronosyltransferase P-like isoform X2 [Pseudomyrmex gracilis]|uniref:galactosylgalactosylxylosylprotein 3-beta-glucuronosyltransferase P-like isoform X2 n=1 Tax=Pseudomyrmex gracilis TaxID=219809 RepID=UPI00099579D9|nr:galactosylgalactosylxylosylprotein 3-beta-glucuronosyltransferase P-like isoform X2 [Pseudomyrmex gracilis]
MKPSMKMGVIALIGICVVFYQYHLSTGVTFDQVTAFNADTSAEDAGLPIGEEAADSYGKTPKLTEDMIRYAAYRVQVANGLSPEISSMLVRELINQLISKNVSVVSRNNSKLPSQAATTAHKSSPTTSEETSEEPLYIITPTYRRPEQIPELTRMAHTLMLVKNVHWLVIEDAIVATKQVTKLLERTGLKFDHLIAPMPEKYKLKKGAKPRGVSNRNRGLQWIRANATRGVFYFADDDNTYDIELFDEIRKTKTVSMFPVGLCTKFGLSSPILKNATERQHAVSRGLRGGRFPKEFGAVRAAGRPVAGGQLHQGARLAHPDEEERAERAARHEDVRRDESGETQAADSMMIGRDDQDPCSSTIREI